MVDLRSLRERRFGGGKPSRIWRGASRVIVVGLPAVSLQGCAAAGLAVLGAGAGVGMGTGVEHELNGISYKTFAVPVDNAHHATRAALTRLGMAIRTDTVTSSGWSVTASAAGRTIDIQLERLTPKATRMRVVADEGGLFSKDSATATEIILQTAQTLQNGGANPAHKLNYGKSAS